MLQQVLIIERSPGRWFVRSRKTAKWYHVKMWFEGDQRVWACDCGDNVHMFPKECWHIQRVKEKEGF